MRGVVTLCAIGLAAASIADAQQMPHELAALAAKARLEGSVAAWCRAEFRSGHRGAFAVGVTFVDGGGRYVALDSDGRVTDTIHGRITPRWHTTVVCGFIDDTEAVCWQYSPVDRAFVSVGRWVT